MSPLPRPPREVPPERSLDGLAPKFRLALARTLHAMHLDGFDPVVFETLRTDERQSFLFGFGRAYDDGRGVVTHSRTADRTWHKYGLAADVISHRYRWDASAAFWQALGDHARAEGLRWGFDWDMDGVPTTADPDERFADRPHVQWGKPMLRSPSPRAAELFRAGGVEAVWQEVGAA